MGCALGAPATAGRSRAWTSQTTATTAARKATRAERNATAVQRLWLTVTSPPMLPLCTVEPLDSVVEFATSGASWSPSSFT